MRVMVALTLFAAALPALGQYRDSSGSCSAEYTWAQCQYSIGDDANAKEPGGGSGCNLPYMCTNTIPRAQKTVVWCRETQSYVNCEIWYCDPSGCNPTNCTPRTEECLDCPSRLGNTADISSC